MRRIEAGGLSFMTGKAGRGPRLLFLGGTGTDLRQPQTVLDSPLVGEFEVLTFDQRGMGRSDKPPGTYSMSDYAADAAAIMDAVGWDRAHVVGYSFGGMVAQELAIGWPERIHRLVLASTTAGGRGGSSFPLETLADLPPLERARRSLEVADMAFTPAWQQQHPEEAAASIRARARQFTAFQDEPGRTQGQAGQLAARAGHDTFDRLHRITAPTLVLAGNRDGQAPLDAQRAMAAGIAGCRFEVIDGSHAMLREGDEAYHHMARFLLENPATRPIARNNQGN